jgi:hypothetical protein
MSTRFELTPRVLPNLGALVALLACATLPEAGMAESLSPMVTVCSGGCGTARSAINPQPLPPKPTRGDQGGPNPAVR